MEQAQYEKPIGEPPPDVAWPTDKDFNEEETEDPYRIYRDDRYDDDEDD